jgi:hypothetical protein
VQVRQVNGLVPSLSLVFTIKYQYAFSICPPPQLELVGQSLAAPGGYLILLRLLLKSAFRRYSDCL